MTGAVKIVAASVGGHAEGVSQGQARPSPKY